ncbi:MAG: tetratricopeptide repeat protein [Deltaproteobacteria bacterium]|nr:tetratricopeptide repeat protein [Deltaproteobacteria bacterium]
MIRKRDGVVCLAAMAVLAVVFSVSPRVFAETTNKPSASAANEVCIPKSVEDKVMTCPGGFKIGDFANRKSVKVSSAEKKEEKKKEKAALGPSLGKDYVKNVIQSSFKKKREKKKIDILKKEIDLIKRLVTQTGNDNPEKAEILKRLADAYQEFYSQLNFMARDLDEKIFQAKEKNAKEAARLKAQQKALDEKAREYRELSIKAYVEIRNNFPDYPAYDEILFAIAYEIDQIASEMEEKEKSKKESYRERARVFYQELIRNYPQSRFIPHAWMAYGEYYFNEARDVERAMKAYEKVVEWGADNNPNYIIAMYYQAWCLFNMQDYKRTINQFNQVIQYAVDHPDNKEAQAVAKRSRMELVDAFSKIGNPSQAWEFFQKIGADLSHKMLIKLAELYYDEGHWADAIIVFHKLEALEIDNYAKNNSDELCHYQTMVTNAVISSRPKDEQLTELKRQLGLYKKFSEEGKHDKQKVKQCAADTLALAVDQALQWHREAVGTESSPGTKDKNTMNLAIGLYDEILNMFPNIDEVKVEGFEEKTRPTKYRIAYYKADLYWAMENWEKCAPAFDAVVEMNPQGEYLAEAAYAAVLCYNKIAVQIGLENKDRTHKLKTDQATDGGCDKKCKDCKKKCKGKDEEKNACTKACDEAAKVVLKPSELTQVQAGMLKSYDRYVCYVSEGQDLVNIKYRRARIYYEANMFAEAAVLFKDIAVKHSDNQLAVYAANLYLDCLNVLGSMVEPPEPSCYDDLASAVDLFIDDAKAPGKSLMKDAEFAGQIKALKVGVLRKKAEALTTRKRFKESAEIYITIFTKYQGVYDDRGMCEVLFNTAINLEAARLVGQAINFRKKMIELYPDCEHSKKAAYYIGANYHALAFYGEAAENYKSFATKYSGEKEAPEALSNAVMFYIGLGRYEQALETMNLFEKYYKQRKPAETATVVFGVGFIYVNEKDYEKLRKHYDSYLKNYGKLKILDEQVQAYVMIGDSYWLQKKPDYAAAEKAYKQALAVYDTGAMDKVPDNKRKAAMLIAAAKARYYVAERKFQEFERITLPEFRSEKEIPKTVEKWWKSEQKPEDLKAAEEWKKYRRLLVRWGEMKKEDAEKEAKKEVGEPQFQYWIKFKFVPWMENKGKVLKDASDMFALVAKMHVPEWEMAAAARVADMQLEFMQTLYDAPVPPSIKDNQELVDIYRESLDGKAQPMHDIAVTLYTHCLNISTKVRWFNENSMRCERELNKLSPQEFPVSEEIRVQNNNRLTVWATPDPILELETAAQKMDRELTTSAAEIGGGTMSSKGEAESASKEE